MTGFVVFLVLVVALVLALRPAHRAHADPHALTRGYPAGHRLERRPATPAR